MKLGQMLMMTGGKDEYLRFEYIIRVIFIHDRHQIFHAVCLARHVEVERVSIFNSAVPLVDSAYCYGLLNMKPMVGPVVGWKETGRFRGEGRPA